MKPLFVSCLTALMAAASAADAAAPRPNIIFILADDFGYGDLGCYGQKKIQTPCLDRMAANGMRFTQFYAGSTVCAPSRCVLMTGQHTGHCWVRGNAGKNNARGQILRPQDVTVAKVLHAAGYATALVGKWGLGEPDTSGIPTKQGFDYFFGYLNQLHAHNYYPAFLWRGEERVTLKNEVPPGNVGDGEFGQGWATKRVEYSHDLFAADALKWVEQNRSKPLFLYLAVTIPHANNEGTRGTGNGQEVPDLGIYKDKDWTEPNKGYAAMVTRMDGDIGRLLASLKQLGLDERTLVMFSSDNGPQKEGGADFGFFDSTGPLRGMKRDLYDGGIRVPMIARWPGRIKAGGVSDHVGYFGDFMATAAELAGIEPPPNLDSISFAPTLLGQPERQKRHDYLYWEFHERGFAQAVRIGDWKAVRLGTKKPVELYDLKTDLGEQHDVAAQHPEVVAEVEAILKSVRTDSECFPIREVAPKKPGVKKKPAAATKQP
ncbi:MAG: arylsulfatase [Verrucomicrobia bacterium]|nr:arylsulfatase [Verrucomicrobiota bacterium]